MHMLFRCTYKSWVPVRGPVVLAKHIQHIQHTRTRTNTMVGEESVTCRALRFRASARAIHSLRWRLAEKGIQIHDRK